MLGNIDRAFLPITVKAVRLSLKTVFIEKVRELGKGEIQVISIVTDGVSAEPIQLQAEVYKKVKKRSFLPIGPAGITLYRTETDGKVPGFLDYRILIMEVDEDIRKVGEMLDEVRQDKQFESFKQSLLAVTTFTAPQIALIGAAADLTLNLVAKIFKGKKDRQLYLLQGSFDNAFDDLGVGFGIISQGNENATITYQVEVV
ncbi:hypothetical protein GCM10011383_14930 [Hymenobacter cavernae]|uniref:VWFA domain-containing protein n=1 Tax=Hymenobacter cavernae TaxID=2044852 RepID=A0ABQ1TW53_9BACT|nr:hypothetical protein GCM10011383_14930 [Hymenobacter cavernae]